MRKFDRAYEVGNDLYLYEFDPKYGEFTGRYTRACIRYITQPGTFGLPADVGVMSLDLIYSRDGAIADARSACSRDA